MKKLKAVINVKAVLTQNLERNGLQVYKTSWKRKHADFQHLIPFLLFPRPSH